ncbi:MAG: class I SAM-dependent methyltransferase [Candidatus Levyibacteriota bacterium]
MINKCRSCKSRNIEDVISLGNLYLPYFTKGNKKPPKFPLTLTLCKDCYLLQLKHTTPTHLLYNNNYGYKSGINKTMQDHLKEIAIDALKKHNNSKRKALCLDIGANDGTLLKNYPKNIYKVGIEPIEKYAKECKKYADLVINDFFNYKSYKNKLGGKKADIITAISCFYDMPDPNKFVKDVTKILDKNGVFIIQQNYLPSMLRLNAFDNIVHEHLEYYSLTSLNNLLKRHNLEIFDVKLADLNGGSFRTYISHEGKQKKLNSVNKMIKIEKKLKLTNKKTYFEFAKRININKDLVKKFISKEVGKGKKVYIYGASTRGNTLLQYFELSKALIPYAVERNAEKWGKKIASLDIPIISEKQARIHKPDYMLVLPWFFKKEFVKREKNYLKNGGRFIFPLPNFKVVK